MEKWKENTVLITGAANGVGRALATALEERGCRLALVDVDEKGLRSLKTRGSRHIGDLGRAEEVRRIVGEAVEKHGSIHYVFNCAGVSVLGPFEDTPRSDIQWILDINLAGTMYVCHECIPYLKKAGGGHIVNVASAAALLGMADKAVYSASKAGVKAFSESLRAELHPAGIGVTCAFLGPVRTGMLSRSRVTEETYRQKTQAYLQSKGMSPEKVAQKILEAVERNRSRALISGESKALEAMVRLFPRFLPWLLQRFPGLTPA
ncbi:MAG: SDR family oxidoreductase [Lewinellaceae bacterium]|nr:SDR family oxidoreductase [Lewinellaceae bacterium]